MTGDLIVRRLARDDAASFKDIRLQGLLDSPEAFGSTYEAEKDNPVEGIAESLSTSYIAGAWLGDQLAGVAGFYQLASAKTAHRGNIWGVYVCPDRRGAGIGRAVIENVLAHARGIVLQVHLSVVTDNAAAVALYRNLGFTTYGTEPRALHIGTRDYDEHLMVIRFD